VVKRSFPGHSRQDRCIRCGDHGMMPRWPPKRN